MFVGKNIAVIFVTALALTACASPQLGEKPAAEFVAEGLYPVKSSGFEEAYVHPDAGLSGYSTVDIAAMNVSDVEVPQTAVSGSNRRDWQMTAQREESLVAAWAQATDRAFQDYQRSQEDQHILRIEAQLTRVSPGRAAGAATSATGAAVRGTSDVTNVAAEFRLYDGAGGQLLAVIRDRRTIASLQWSGAAGADMVNLLNSWAGLLHTRVSGK